MTQTPTLDDDLALAHRLADAAGAVSVSFSRRELHQWSKDDGSLATEADLAVEDDVRSRLAVERSDEPCSAKRAGSRARARADGSWTGSTGLLTLPPVARLGDADCAGPLRASTRVPLTIARSYLPPPEWLPDERARTVAKALASATRPEAHVNHPASQVATGGYEVAVFFMAGPWDLAGPSLIVEESGGRFTDLAGQYRLTSGNAVFSNGLLHDEVIALAASMLGR